MSYVVIGWQWLKMALSAAGKLEQQGLSAKETAFFQGKIHTLEFYCKYELPHTAACRDTLLNELELTNIKVHDLFS